MDGPVQASVPSPGPAPSPTPLADSAASVAAATPHPDAKDCLTPFLPHGTVSPNPQGKFTKDPEHGWLIGDHPDLTPALRQRLHEILVARRHCFAYSLGEMPGYCGIDGEFTIELDTDKPIFRKPRRYTAAEEAVIDAKCAELRDAGIIVRAAPGTKYACCPTLPAKKAPDGTWTDYRFCIDYRPINQHTIPDRYALHLPEDLFRQVGNATIFSKLDLRGAFHQVPIRVEDQPKTAFWWKNELWQYTRMPYGLVSGSAKCQRLMDLELAAAGLSQSALVFVDDCLSYATSMEAALEGIAALLDALHAAGLRVHPEKSVLLTDQCEFLGYSLNPAGLSPHHTKVAAIQALSSPACLTELRSKLAFMNYYRCFVPEFATIAAPLNALLRKDAPWVWATEHEQAFQRLKEILCTPGVLLRRFDRQHPITVYTDWSGVGIAAALAQQQGSEPEYLVACVSRSLNPAERNYPSYSGEALAAVWGVQSFRQYLHGNRFRLVTDHQPLKWLMGTPDLTGKHMRWALILQEYTFTIEHRPGRAHANVDVPSRYPLPITFDPTGACLDPVTPTAALAAHPLALYTDSDSPAFFPSPTITFPDTFSPTAAELLDVPTLLDTEAWASFAATAEWNYLRAYARLWVDASAADLQAEQASVQQLCLDLEASADLHGVRPTLALSTVPVGAAFLDAAQGSGIVLYEMFGGLCAGLDMALANGLRVAQYLYSDIDPAAQAVAKQRVAVFHAQYPHLFEHSASAAAFSALPMDVRQVDTVHLLSAGAQEGRQWLVVAGWSCEDLSPAGKGRGLAGDRSSNFFDAVRVVGTLQQLQPVLPPAFVMENTAMQLPSAHRVVREQDFPLICSILGRPVLVDAARFGSYAHRLRNFWSNLAPAEHVARVVEQAQRVPGRLVDAVLDEGRRSQLPAYVPRPPFYQCNRVGQPLCALPTLVAFTASRAFRDGGPGMLVIESTGELAEPNPDERERILGYGTGCTRAPGVTELQRHALTGRAMDRNTVVHLMAVYNSLAVCGYGGSGPVMSERAVTLSAELPQLYGAVAPSIMAKYGWRPGLPLLSPHAQQPLLEPVELPGVVGRAGVGYTPGLGGGTSCDSAACAHMCDQLQALSLGSAGSRISDQASPAVYSEADLHWRLCYLAETADKAEVHEKSSDPLGDEALLFFLVHGKMPQGVEQREAARVRSRAKRYSMVDGRLQRVMIDGSTRVVPPVEERTAIIRSTHERTGHFGIKRTKHMLLASFWWPGLEADVVKVLATCEPCARIKASFNAERPQLQPLSVEGMFYRWGVDLAGPFAESADGNLYVVICIEHFSKAVELSAIKAKTAMHTAHAFLSTVLSRYGACAEVVTDRGAEFEGAFHQLLVDCLIDHRTTSPNHPQADGLAERCVQTIKKALAKYVAQHKQLGDWDWQLHWVGLGYRASKQAATGLSPYEMLYGTQPIIPPAIRQRVVEPVLEFTDPEQAAEYVLQRAELLKRHCAIAMSNIRIAQHRDTLRYQQVRSGCYMPVRVKFAEGDFVYVRRRTVTNSLQSEARPGIYRVLAVKPSGVLVLQGRCGTTMNVNVEECAPCHLSNINPVLDPQLQRVDADFPCDVCGSPDDEEVMLICDGCFKGYHIYCLQPPLAAVPQDAIWLCDPCKASGLDAQAVAVLRQQNLPVAQSDAALFPSVQQRAHDAAAQQLQGRTVWMPAPASEGSWVQGKLEYVQRMDRSEHSRCPLRFVVQGRPPVALSLRKATKLVEAGVPEGYMAHHAAAVQQQPMFGVFVAAREPQEWRGKREALQVLDCAERVAQAVQSWCGVEATSDAFLQQCLEACLAVQAGGGSECDLLISGDAMQALLRAVDLWPCARVAIAGGSCAVVAQQMKQRYGKALWEADKQPGKGADQLSVAWYKKAHTRVPLEWVFLCPPEGLDELALGLAVQQARKGVAMFAHRPVLTNRSAVMAAMLRGFEAAGRAVYLTCSSSSAVWVLVFASEQLKHTMMFAKGVIPGSDWIVGG